MVRVNDLIEDNRRRDRVIANSEDWLTCPDPVAMIKYLRFRNVSQRKYRLFCCHVLQASDLWNMETHRRDVEIIMTLDGNTTDRVPSTAIGIHRRPYSHAEEYSLADRKGIPTKSQRADMLRDLIGDPFNPIRMGITCRYCNEVFDVPDKYDWRFCPECKKPLMYNAMTEEVRSMAERIYREEDWLAMAVLADRMEELGCVVQVFLDHMRQPQHWKGCWVLDLLTGRK
jgi:hypothetical protein